MVGQIAIGGVQIRLIVAGILDASFPVVGHNDGGHTLKEIERPDVGANPTGQIPAPGRFGKGIVAGSQNGHKDYRLVALAGLGIHNRNGRTGMIDKQLLAGPVLLSQGQVQLAGPAVVKLTEAAVLVTVGMGLLVLLPQQLEGQVAVASQFLMERGKVGQGHRTRHRSATLPEQPPLQRGLVQIRRQWPGKPGGTGPP